jgi:hypothetical protein
VGPRLARYFFDLPVVGFGDAVEPVLLGFAALMYSSVRAWDLSAVFALFATIILLPVSPFWGSFGPVSLRDRPIEALNKDKAATTADLEDTVAAFSGGLIGF